ncbi:hypothetical protein KFL_000780170 [Klebsormidium nitens]|uniref:Uncharacterized protein n=1 Tax=Klebsormidium nitens TaxID=105231 RepID=A0A1Y1HRU4_KLENI|nr:hypothetical protein KFL_000780170 [Klebsormidium nitens]|eukprot:GAQ81355.1 hypothetical protein KFL_000780170 [Klebsormidium nitens]
MTTLNTKLGLVVYAPLWYLLKNCSPLSCLRVAVKQKVAIKGMKLWVPSQVFTQAESLEKQNTLKVLAKKKAQPALTRTQKYRTADKYREEVAAVDMAHVKRLDPSVTGLPMSIWLSPRHGDYSPRLWVAQDYGEQGTAGEWFIMSVAKHSKSVGNSGRIDIDDFEIIEKFIRKNRKLLEACWEQDTCFDIDDVVARLKKLSTAQSQG